MKAMVLERLSTEEPAGREPEQWAPLVPRDLPTPKPGPGQVLIRVSACGVCRTELDQAEGRIAPPKLPVIVGHQPVGVVTEVGPGVRKLKAGDLVGATWIFSSCGRCRWCLRGEENLCVQFQATGCHADGGYAEYMVIAENYALQIPGGFADPTAVAPLMCAGVVGYRSLRLTAMEDGMTLGLFGFGSANHLVLQMANALFPESKTFVFSRNPVERALAIALGASWAGEIHDDPPELIDRAIDTTPAWGPVLRAMERLAPGGQLVINAIRKQEMDKQLLLDLDYARHLWLEKEIKSVANVTRKDGEEFVAIAAQAHITPVVEPYPLERANEALADLKQGRIRGSKVLVMDNPQS